MSIVFLTGDHPRHAFLAGCLAKTGLLRGIVRERREPFVPVAPATLRQETRALFTRHFAERGAAETRFFGDGEGGGEFEEVESLNVDQNELNSPLVYRFLDRLRPELLISYGVHKLGSELLSHAPGLCWNIHGGLSPWYRGVATHFWPSYFLEPQMTGMTVHELTDAIDGGDIIHQVAAPLVPNDGLHDLACRAVAELGAELPGLTASALKSPPRTASRQGSTGRIWRSQDWRPEHLHVIYDLYGNRIVDRYLDGQFERRSPTLVRAV